MGVSSTRERVGQIDLVLFEVVRGLEEECVDLTDRVAKKRLRPEGVSLLEVGAGGWRGRDRRSDSSSRRARRQRLQSTSTRARASRPDLVLSLAPSSVSCCWRGKCRAAYSSRFPVVLREPAGRDREPRRSSSSEVHPRAWVAQAETDREGDGIWQR